MGHAEKKSMLYLEARCLLMIKGGGVQGTQNGSISCIGLVGAVPSGHPGGACGERWPPCSAWRSPPAMTRAFPTRTSGAPPGC